MRMILSRERCDDGFDGSRLSARRPSSFVNCDDGARSAGAQTTGARGVVCPGTAPEAPLMQRYARSTARMIRASAFSLVLILPALLAACGQGNGGGAGY
jgi:hypothetical protein